MFGRKFARLDGDRAGRADEFTKLAGDAAFAAVLVLHESRGATIVRGQMSVPLLLRILHEDFGPSQQHVLEVLERDGEAPDDGGKIEFLPPRKFRSWNRV